MIAMRRATRSAKMPGMAPQDIRRLILRDPFQPLRIHISDGASYDVRDPSLVYVALTDVSIGIDPDESGLPRRSVYLAPNHVSRIEVIEPVAPAEAGMQVP